MIGLFSYSNMKKLFAKLKNKQIKTPHTTRHVSHSLGFTSIEFLVVLGVIGIIAVGIIFALDPFAQMQKIRDDRRIEDLNEVQDALEVYFQDYGKYPASSTNLQIVDAGSGPKAWGNMWKPYLDQLPQDPQGKTYIYFSDPGNQRYWLYASLDGNENTCNGNISVACTNASSNGIADRCGGTCNYGVSSPNTSP